MIGEKSEFDLDALVYYTKICIRDWQCRERGTRRIESGEYLQHLPGRKNPSVIVNDLWVKSTLSQLTAETKVAIRVSGWANKTAQSAMTNWISQVSKRRPKWFEAQEFNNSLGLKKKRNERKQVKKKKALFKKSITSKQNTTYCLHTETKQWISAQWYETAAFSASTWSYENKCNWIQLYDSG